MRRVRISPGENIAEAEGDCTTSRLVSKLTGMVVPGNKAIVGANAFAHESGIHQDGMLKEKTTYEIMSPETIGLKESKLVLGKHSGRHAFREKLIDLGYELGRGAVNAAFAKFKDLADKKKKSADEDIRAMMEEKLIDTPEVFTLGDDSGDLWQSNRRLTATVRYPLGVMARLEEQTAEGNGSVDAIYNAIDKATAEKRLSLRITPSNPYRKGRMRLVKCMLYSSRMKCLCKAAA